jgi:hypothetical protein
MCSGYTGWWLRWLPPAVAHGLVLQIGCVLQVAALAPKIEAMEASWNRLRAISGTETPNEVVEYWQGAQGNTPRAWATNYVQCIVQVHQCSHRMLLYMLQQSRHAFGALTISDCLLLLRSSQVSRPKSSTCVSWCR